MSELSFLRDVKGIFSKYVADMNHVKLATPSGTQVLQLGNYESVKFFYYEIQVAIHGYDFKNGEQIVEDYQLLPVRGGFPGEVVKSAPHPMPMERGILPQEGIDIYDQWVRDGMLP